MKLNKINYITCKGSPNTELNFYYDRDKVDFFQDLDIYKNNVSKEEHDDCLRKIKNGIAYNREGIITKLDLILFAKAYPESMNYVNDYLNVFFDEVIKHDVEIRSVSRYAFDRSTSAHDFWKIRKNLERILLSMLYYSYLIDEDKEKRAKAIKTLGLSKINYSSVIRAMDKYLGEEHDNKYYGNLVREYVKMLLDNRLKNNDNLTNDELDEIFNKDNPIIYNSLDKNKQSLKKMGYEEVKESMVNNSTYLLSNAEIISDYINNGIPFNGEIISFSYLDFRSMIDLMPKDFFYSVRSYHTVNDPYNIAMITLEKFCTRKYEITKLQTPSEFVKKAGKYILGGITYTVDNDLAEFLFNLYEENGIPTTYSLLEIGAKRVFRNQPVLPVIELNKEKNDINKISKGI